jgi:protein-ribulosamine 3-kinase
MSLEDIREAIEEQTGLRPEGAPETITGGCINDSFRLGDFFVKTNSTEKSSMFSVEELGLQTLHAADAVRVPQAICSGITSSQAFLVLELLPLAGGPMKSQEELGRQLACLHRTTAPQFGWDHDNFIGPTPQPNQKCDSWIEFVREHRLAQILKLAEGCGYHFPIVDRLLAGIDRFFEGDPTPSLLHGDLWSGNASSLADGTPVIFDPAVYFGDREADLAMTRLFGGFSASFYAAYSEAWPLSPGHEQRCEFYNLYHILNHAVLFGGGYARQAQGIIARLVSQLE